MNRTWLCTKDGDEWFGTQKQPTDVDLLKVQTCILIDPKKSFIRVVKGKELWKGRYIHEMDHGG